MGEETSTERPPPDHRDRAGIAAKPHRQMRGGSLLGLPSLYWVLAALAGGGTGVATGLRLSSYPAIPKLVGAIAVMTAGLLVIGTLVAAMIGSWVGETPPA